MNDGPATGDASPTENFTRDGVRAGVLRTIPVAITVFVYGLIFGVLTAGNGLSIGETLLMSGTVFAGTAQLVALGMWGDPLPVAGIILTTALVNSRLTLMSASLVMQRAFDALPRTTTYSSLFFVSDESWALTMAEQRRGPTNSAFLLGRGFALYLSWVSSTAIGHLTGSATDDPARFGLDFAFVAVFIALIVGFWRGPQDIPPWAVAAGTAIAGSSFMPANTHILLGCVAGIAVAALRE